MSRKPSAKAGAGAASASKPSPNIEAAIAAANELTERAARHTAYVGYVEMGLRELLTTYRDTANPNLQKIGLRITNLDIDLEYGVNPQDPAKMVERDDEARMVAKELAYGVLHVSVKGAPPLAVNLTVLLTPRSTDDGTMLSLLIGNRKEGETADPYIFIMEVDEQNPKSFAMLANAKGDRGSLLHKANDDDLIGICDYLTLRISDLIVAKRTMALISEKPQAA